MVKKTDLILLAAVVVLCAAALVLLYVFSGSGQTVVITCPGGSRELPLNVDETVIISDENYGYNTVVIKDGMVYVSEADCRDEICVNHAPISKTGEIIVCLPHKLTVEIR